MNRQNNFTLLRLILAILIVVTHSYGITGYYHQQPIVFNNDMFGPLRLYMFFFISGFLVTGSALNTRSNRSFVLKRVLRIYPALIVLVLFTVFVVGPLFTTLSLNEYFSHPGTWKYLLTMSGFHLEFYLPGVFQDNYDKSVNASLWTIALELKLYLVLVASLVTGFMRTKYYVWTAFFASLFFVVLAIVDFRIDGTAYSSKVWKLVAIYFLGSSMQIFKWGNSTNLAVFAVSLGILILRISGILEYQFFLEEVFFYATFSWILAYLVKPVVRLENDYSYGLYLYAFPVQQMLIVLSQGKMAPMLNIALTMLVAGCLAVLSWKYIEKPALSLKRYLPSYPGK